MRNEAVTLAIKMVGTQQKLGECSGITQGTISAYKLLRKRPSPDAAKRMSSAVQNRIPWYSFIDGTLPPDHESAA